MKLRDAVVRVRSKNAGPFWVTIDVFCGSKETLAGVMQDFSADRIAQLVSQPVESIKLFEVSDLGVLKISFPRSVVQGCREDRDMHGAQYAHLIAEASYRNAAIN